MRDDRREELPVDEVCARCATPIVVTASTVRQAGELYCCANCARAAGGEPPGVAGGEPPVAAQACSHCGAPIVERVSAVEADGRRYCCANCAAVPLEVEPPIA